MNGNRCSREDQKHHAKTESHFVSLGQSIGDSNRLTHLHCPASQSHVGFDLSRPSARSMLRFMHASSQCASAFTRDNEMSRGESK